MNSVLQGDNVTALQGESTKVIGIVQKGDMLTKPTTIGFATRTTDQSGYSVR